MYLYAFLPGYGIFSFVAIRIVRKRIYFQEKPSQIGGQALIHCRMNLRWSFRNGQHAIARIASVCEPCRQLGEGLPQQAAL